MTASPLFDVSGRLALVTGSTRGIGRALALGLLRAGCDVAVNGRDPDVVARTAAELNTLTALDGGAAGTAHPAAFDVTDPAAVDAAVAALERDVAGPGGIDILVNNAGMQHRKPFHEFTDAEWQQILDLNLTSAFTVARSVSRGMIARRSGRIVNILSVQSELARPGIAPYSATKGGLKMLTRGMCADLAGYGIGVNGLGPGYFATELNAALVADETFSAWVAGRTPAGRWGEVDELVGPLLFLCSPASGFVNGQILHVDGGMLAVL